jgi:uncharacterized protein (DUF4213/DUF364 family)
MERIVDLLLASIKKDISNVENLMVGRVYIGFGFTIIRLSSGHVGLCHSLQSEMSSNQCCEMVNRAGTLAGSAAMDLANMSRSWDIGERVVGVATINALSQIILEQKMNRYKISDGNLIEEININPSDTIAMVGNMRPIFHTLKKKAKQVLVFERGTILDNWVLPYEACEEFIPKADVVIITGTAITNGTIDRMLELSKQARLVALIGPSATVIPDPLFEKGVSVIGGSIVVDPDKVLQIVAEGGGIHQLKNSLKFIVIEPK